MNAGMYTEAIRIKYTVMVVTQKGKVVGQEAVYLPTDRCLAIHDNCTCPKCSCTQLCMVVYYNTCMAAQPCMPCGCSIRYMAASVIVYYNIIVT